MWTKANASASRHPSISAAGFEPGPNSKLGFGTTADVPEYAHLAILELADHQVRQTVSVKIQYTGDGVPAFGLNGRIIRHYPERRRKTRRACSLGLSKNARGKQKTSPSQICDGSSHVNSVPKTTTF